MDTFFNFNEGDTNNWHQLLVDNSYPVLDNFIIPNQFLVSFQKGSDSSFDKHHQEWFKDVWAGKQVTAFFKLNKKKGKKINEIKFKLINICKCCNLQLAVISADLDILRFLEDNADISPGNDNDPRGSSFQIVCNNSYTFSSGIDSKSSIKTQNIDLKDILSQYGNLSNEPKAVKVAVIDTGFKYENLAEQGIEVNIWQNKHTTNSCNMSVDIVGWNFIDDNNNPSDDNPSEHGTIISAIISKTANILGVEYLPEIMVLKAFNSNGVGTLYTIICALCYSKAHSANIINASFVCPTSGLGIEYLKRIIRDLGNIILVCAAGNRRSITDNVGLGLGLLSTTPLYPACFSAELNNVITVTSLWEMGVENYSPTEPIVNICVYSNKKGYFNAPYLWFRNEIDAIREGRRERPIGVVQSDIAGGGINRIVGSSYATAFVTGFIVYTLQNADGVMSLDSGNLRESIFTYLKNEGKLIENGRMVYWVQRGNQISPPF